ncbi:MAG TPA: hypothetical protein DEG47_04180 [Cyanobacteria bacterium UBA11148]|nr:hypothetical protein [Cyanobacteria bacterium UBA11148]
MIVIPSCVLSRNFEKGSGKWGVGSGEWGVGSGEWTLLNYVFDCNLVLNQVAACDRTICRVATAHLTPRLSINQITACDRTPDFRKMECLASIIALSTSPYPPKDCKQPRSKDTGLQLNPEAVLTSLSPLRTTFFESRHPGMRS